MEVEFEMNADDVLAFQRYHAAHPLKLGAGRKARVSALDLLLGGMYAVVVVAMLVISFLWRHSFRNSEILVFVGLIEAGFVSFVTLYYIKLKSREFLRRSMRERRDELDRQRLKLTAQGVVHSSPRGEGINYWSGIKRLGVTDSHLFIYITSVSAYTVPRRAFADDPAFWTFVNAAERYQEDAQAAPGGARWRSIAAPASPQSPDATPADEFFSKPEGMSGKGEEGPSSAPPNS
jgi:hypothetical protein